jgi:hypothetical protein
MQNNSLGTRPYNSCIHHRNIAKPELH